MNARELRIGNYINIQGLNKPIPVSIIDTTETSEQTTCNPIEITEEWLLNFGFYKSAWDNYSSFRKMIGDNDYAIVIDESGDCMVGDITIKSVKYVHQLQNLYYALTGKELKLNT